VTDRQKKLVDEIVARWHVRSYRHISVQQAALDIGVLCGIIYAMEPDPKVTGSAKPA
jgi:hypothetical protein